MIGSTPPIYLRPLRPADAGALLDMRARNRSEFQPAEPLRDDSFFTLEQQHELITTEAATMARGESLLYGVFVGDTLIGRVALTGIARGPFMNAYLGYHVDRNWTNRGVATTAVREAVRQAWDAGLHRIQAAVALPNVASKRVLAKVGFRWEGLARNYLRLAGEWTDHELWAITTDDQLRAPSPDA
jgi:ribosomal-protein-alanine N-acetyltransferase